MHATRKLWTWLAVICALSFAVLGWVGAEIYQTAPPIPKEVISEKGEVIFKAGEVQHGQQAWLSAGGQQQGSIWGHGSYVAPDWSADWLHREAIELRKIWAKRDFNKTYEELNASQKGQLNGMLKEEMRKNTRPFDDHPCLRDRLNAIDATAKEGLEYLLAENSSSARSLIPDWKTSASRTARSIASRVNLPRTDASCSTQPGRGNTVGSSR